mgnify:CR=1 FL=1
MNIFGLQIDIDLSDIIAIGLKILLLIIAYFIVSPLFIKKGGWK